MPQPMVVLASGAGLGPGFARDLFLRWASNPANLVLFSDRDSAPPHSLSRDLLTQLTSPSPFPPSAPSSPPLASSSSSSASSHVLMVPPDRPPMVDLTVGSRVPLDGDELVEYLVHFISSPYVVGVFSLMGKDTREKNEIKNRKMKNERRQFTWKNREKRGRETGSCLARMILLAILLPINTVFIYNFIE